MHAKEAAYLLYEAGMKQGDIADLLKVTQKTVSDWKKKEGWEQKRTRATLAQHSAEEGVLGLINHNMRVLQAQIKEQEDSGQLQLIKAGDIDALTKLFSAIKGKERTWTHYVQIVRELMTYLQIQNLDLAKTLLPYTDAFLEEKRQQL